METEWLKSKDGSYHHFIKKNDYVSMMEKNNSQLHAKNDEISVAKSELSQLKAEFRAQEPKLQLENFINLAAKLYGQNEFADVKIVCNGKIFECHKLVLICQSDVFKTMIKNKSLIEKQFEGVMEINENDFSSDTMEQILYYLYFQKVKDNKVINTDLMIAADKYNVKGLLDVCTNYLGSNLSEENALDVLVKAELIDQKKLFDAASKFVCNNIGRVNKTSAWEEICKKNPTMIADLFSKMSVVE